jgi:uncharacterized protein (DUF3084 family)
MSDFKVIETQEDFDERIKDRLRRAEDKVREQYKDYDDIKKQYEDLSEKVKTLTTEKADAENDRDKYSATVKKYEKEALQVKVAREAGLPYEMASRIAGDDEDAMKKDAKAIKALFDDNKPEAPFGGSGEPNRTVSDSDEKWLDFAKSLEED